MNWFLAVVFGHFFNAISTILNKVLLTKSIDNAFAFTFYIGVLGLLAVVLIPFGFEVPTGRELLINGFAGALTTAALLFLFLALAGGETSRIIPFIGALIPITTLVFEVFVLEQQLTQTQYIACTILIIGTILITLEVNPSQKRSSKSFWKRMCLWCYGALAGILFALSFGFTKLAFETQPFFSAFVWMRFGAFFFPLTFLFFAPVRRAIVDSATFFRQRAGAVYIASQALGAAGFTLINYAISIASVSLVNAMQGVQYVIVLLLAVIATVKYPALLKEHITPRSLALKGCAVVIIGYGLYLISTTYV